MSSKRANVATIENENKRARMSEDGDELAEYEVQLGGEIFVNIDMLFNFPAYKSYFDTSYSRSVKRFISGEGLQPIYVSKTSLAKGELITKASYAPRSDARLVKKTEDVVKLLKAARDSSYSIAPPVIEDEDLDFFTDESGQRYQIEMRGERTMDGIFFRPKDVGIVLESDSFANTIQHPRSSYRESIDFVWFALQYPASPARKERVDPGQGHSRDGNTLRQEHGHHSRQQKQAHHHRQEIFLTFSGLMHALHSTRSRVTNEFRDWVYKQVFALGYSTVQQKSEMLSTLINVDKAFLEAFIIWFRMISPEQELLLLDDEGYKSVRAIMHTIADKYNGSRSILAEVHDREMKERGYGYQMRIKDLEHTIEVLELRTQRAIADENPKPAVPLLELKQQLAAKDSQLAAKDLQLAAKDSQVTEEKSKVDMLQQQLSNKLENMELRQEITAIKYAAETKDRGRHIEGLLARISELEKTIHSFSKSTSEAT